MKRVLSALGIALGIAAFCLRESGAREAATPDSRVQLRAGSELSRGGVLVPGRTVNAAPVLARASEMLGRVPPGLAPAQLVLELSPRLAPGVPAIAGIEFHAPSGALLLGERSEALTSEIWLHEIGHVRMHGSRPSAPVAKRLLSAIEEGVADYYAAAISGSPRVGDESELRDLTRAPRLDETDWMRLASRSFEPHRLGFALAARLYRESPEPGPLLEDAIGCLDGPSAFEQLSEGPSNLIRGLLAECPERSRARLAALFSAWMPPEISSPESLP